jgi:hypothetical protein
MQLTWLTCKFAESCILRHLPYWALRTFSWPVVLTWTLTPVNIVGTQRIYAHLQSIALQATLRPPLNLTRPTLHWIGLFDESRWWTFGFVDRILYELFGHLICKYNTKAYKSSLDALLQPLESGELLYPQFTWCWSRILGVEMGNVQSGSTLTRTSGALDSFVTELGGDIVYDKGWVVVLCPLHMRVHSCSFLQPQSGAFPQDCQM